ncbi:ribbon-helix-helix protein, CopG family [Myxococcota bacterium]|nr:ribbon-helix-helix protein, CopG family [Myxococcota bacterium]
MSITSIRLKAELESPLDDLAKKLDRTKNYLINQAIKEFVARQTLADERWTQTMDAIESIESGQSIEESKVGRWLESWGSKKELKPPK